MAWEDELRVVEAIIAQLSSAGSMMSEQQMLAFERVVRLKMDLLDRCAGEVEATLAPKEASVFDARYYLARHRDLREAFGEHGYAAALDHWLTTGLPREGRRASRHFDVRYYLANNPDLVDAFGAEGYEEALQHWLNHGIGEGRRPYPEPWSRPEA